MKNKKFQNININLSILIRKNYNIVIIINVYINNFLIASKTIYKINCIKTVFNKVF